MTSADLAKRGFAGWRRFKRQDELTLLAALPVSAGVYCFRSTTQSFVLSKGASDILYVGSAANVEGLRGRLRQYFHPGPSQWTNKRILTRCGDSDDFEIGFKICSSGAEARQVESELIDQFFSEHEQLPPENRQRPEPKPAPRSTADLKAQRMFNAVAGAPLGSRTRSTLLGYVSRNDCDGILRYLERCIATQRDVGRSIQAAGRASFESQMPIVRKIYNEP